MYIAGKREFWFEQHRLACNRQGLCLTGSAFLLMQKWNTRGWDSWYGYLPCGWTDHPGLPLWSLEKKIKTSPASPGLLHVNCPGYLKKNMSQALLPEHLWGQFRWGQMVPSSEMLLSLVIVLASWKCLFSAKHREGPDNLEKTCVTWLVKWEVSCTERWSC